MQLDIFSSIPKTPQELHRQVFQAHAERQALAQRTSARIRELQDQWGGGWCARFLDGRAFVAPGTWVYLPGGASLIVARVDAQPGLADRARLTCLKVAQSIDSIITVSDLTDDFVTRHKPQVFMPVVLYSDRHSATLAAKLAPKGNGKAKAKPWTDREIRALVQAHIAQHWDGVAHQFITIARGYKGDTLERKAANSILEEIQMKLLISGRSFDSDDLIFVFFEVLDEIAKLPEMSTQFQFTR
ncbi:hypothetical protein [Nodosilinea nodulosa]|uniref:hypothetical protein n=1 Tax=Nodosilinea nodulosa TaxID=416001 RepID=UPI000373F490|nr:hypothetical protein [Nodosilinea nodulosa]